MNKSSYDYNREDLRLLEYYTDDTTTIVVDEEQKVQFNSRNVRGYINSFEVFSIESETDLDMDYLISCILQALIQVAYGIDEFNKWLSSTYISSVEKLKELIKNEIIARKN